MPQCAPNNVKLCIALYLYGYHTNSNIPLATASVLLLRRRNSKSRSLQFDSLLRISVFSAHKLTFLRQKMRPFNFNDTSKHFWTQFFHSRGKVYYQMETICLGSGQFSCLFFTIYAIKLLLRIHNKTLIVTSYNIVVLAQCYNIK
jgi:hypothetical protein